MRERVKKRDCERGIYISIGLTKNPSFVLRSLLYFLFLLSKMEPWLLIILTAFIASLFKFLLSSIFSNTKTNIPPGPRCLPIISHIQWLRKSSTEMEAAVRKLSSKFGPIVTLPIGRFPAIFVSSHTLAHRALVQYGAVTSDRAKPLPTANIFTSNQHTLSTANYGQYWRLLRRNFTSQVHPSKAKDFSHARKWALSILLNRLRDSSGFDHTDAVRVLDHFRFAMFCLLVFMCFGEKLDDARVEEILDVQCRSRTARNFFAVPNFWPSLTRILNRSSWNELFDIRRKQEEVLLPKIRSRKDSLGAAKIPDEWNNTRLVNCHVDSLLTMEIAEGDTMRRLTEDEIVSLCSEFLNGGTDTTTTALQWIMANLVKYPEIQAKLFEEIKGVVGKEVVEVEEAELSKMPYLKAIVLEGLRRHPPAHFLLWHTVNQDLELGGYKVPKNANINFMIADMNMDPEVWEHPMDFKPERFLSEEGSVEEFDLTGSREIKMMSFGAGTRICPAIGLAMLHLEYYVANLVLNFEWKAMEGDDVDMSEKQEHTTVMKHPLHAHISPRKKP